ncbi:hypothetical protein ONS95_007276 [Cadophora gregata]|uniref:uncharacterized protein n=1 Tax=Cadophora gregata TaxID=51156 RepID=UPI0026DCD872|nr:uncharacterized protein ONS95_007276 [Cadophora gregata]KAK0100828.1 hypothetical protein ONS95_007276 [Cadophora gregata]KAK0117178.1 hypothetical protein ONS96_013011 [Cadophora gregata f. sp. sojae]
MSVAHHLLTLPREIRDEIYSWILISPTGYVRPINTGHSPTDPMPANPQFTYSHHTPFQRTSSESISFTILRTCRQIYVEAKDVFWKNNIIVVRWTQNKDAWREDMGICRSIMMRENDRIAKEMLGKFRSQGELVAWGVLDGDTGRWREGCVRGRWDFEGIIPRFFTLPNLTKR